MTNTEACQLLLNLGIHGKKKYHAGYDWTVEYAKRSKAHFAGVGIDDYLKKFARRESDELFAQRKEITKHVQSSMGAMLDRPFAKASRSNWTKVIAFNGDEKGEVAQRFQSEVLNQFTQEGVDGFTFDRIRYWNKFDPNCFVVVEFQSTDGRERARPYPFEVRADMAVDFRYTVHGDLEYLAVMQVQEKPSNGTMQKVERFTLYQPMQTVVLQQLTQQEVEQMRGSIPIKSEVVPPDIVDGQLLNIGQKVYAAIIPLPHGYPITPAVRTGFIENPADDGATRVGIFDAALPFAEKVVKINSELDLTTALIAFPIPARYADACDAVGCGHGKLPDGTVCGMCHGTGLKTRPTSVQEELIMDMPRNPEDMVDLSKMMHYFSPPVETVTMQLDLMKHYFQQAKEAVFNSEMFSKQETAQTATFHGIALQSVYDTIYPYATAGLARCWKFITEACKTFTGFKGRMTAMLVIPHDFSFETADDLFNGLKLARDAEAGNDSTAYLDERIMERLLIDDPERLSRWRIDNAFNPFRGMTEAQILTAINSSMVPEWQKIWWINRQWLMAEILEENPMFYMMQASAQRKLIMKKVETLKSEIAAAQPAIELGGIGDNNPQPQPNQ